MLWFYFVCIPVLLRLLFHPACFSFQAIRSEDTAIYSKANNICFISNFQLYSLQISHIPYHENPNIPLLNQPILHPASSNAPPWLLPGLIPPIIPNISRTHSSKQKNKSGNNLRQETKHHPNGKRASQRVQVPVLRALCHQPIQDPNPNKHLSGNDAV